MWPERLRSIVALLLLISWNGTPAAAHSLKELEDTLSQQEYYVEITGRDAPKFTLEDANGRSVSLDDFRGKVVILNFIYATCKEACPLHTAVIGQIQQMVNKAGMRDKVEFISITTDPESDAPDVLKAFGPAYGLDPANWMFLTSGGSKPTETRELGERYGLKFTRTEDGDFMHAIVTHVIDQQGVMRARFHSLKFDPVNLVVFVNALVNDRHSAATEEETSNPLWAEIGDMVSSLRTAGARFWAAVGFGILGLGATAAVILRVFRKRIR